MQSDDIHQQLIENAIDFIEKSLEEFETNLKYSIIHFAIGVELILKARLMNEHWSLTLENIDRISFQNFLDGSAKTVSANKLVERINGLSEKPEINRDANEAFKNIFSERNKVIHFINNNLDKNKMNIVRLHFIAWIHLLQLIDNWEFIDNEIKTSFLIIDKYFRSKYHHYQEIIYDRGKKQKEINKKNGYEYFTCSSCYFESMKSKNIEGNIYESECYVCLNDNSSFFNKFFLLNCPQCKKQIIFPCGDAGNKRCKCTHEFTSNEIKDQLDTGCWHKNEIMDSPTINCSNCMSLGSGIEHHSLFICIECGYSDDKISTCECCQEAVLGENVDLEDSYLCGCPFCEGKLVQDNS